MNFVDFQVGQTFEFGTTTITEDEIVEFATRYDPQPFHIDKAAAEATRWKGLIASGFQTCAIAMRMVVEHALQESDSVGSPGLEYLRWPNPVRAGDRMRLRLQVLERTVSKSGRIGSVRWQWLLLNQDEQVVLDLVATSLFALKPSAG
jgi:acyl dehydratase